jgi:hypothetical protein
VFKTYTCQKGKMMKKLIMIIAVLALAGPAQVGAQNKSSNTQTSSSQEASLPKFDLVFEGGSPGKLVAALNEQVGGTVNVVIPKEAQDVEIPALRFKHVNVVQIFDAVSNASQRMIPVETFETVGVPGGSFQRPASKLVPLNYRFMTTPPVAENSVWYFRVERVEPRPKTCKYYQLAGFLDQYKIEDITTAIKTGWDMLGIRSDSIPQLKFHQDTRLLVAVGDASKLMVIDDVLSELRKSSGLPMPPQKKSSEKESKTTF